MLIMDVNTIILNRKIMTAVGTNGEPTVNCNGKKKIILQHGYTHTVNWLFKCPVCGIRCTVVSTAGLIYLPTSLGVTYFIEMIFYIKL